MHSTLLRDLHLSLTVQGRVTAVDPRNARFELKLLSGDSLLVSASPTTWYDVLRNIGDASRDRVKEPPKEVIETHLGPNGNAPDLRTSDMHRNVLRYVQTGRMVSIEGVYSQGANGAAFSARRVLLADSRPDEHAWESTHWWVHQINALFEQWLDVLFESRRELTENDFAGAYRTNLDLFGGVAADDTQECATLSRFLYGLSSSFLLTGNPRALSAARACASFLMSTYADMSHDGDYVFWKFGRRRDGRSHRMIFASENPDDRGAFALYEQIYALSGLTQYYRVTQDPVVLSYITRTMDTFDTWYRDHAGDGWWSHIDPVTLRPDGPLLEGAQNARRKNWNSIGDHIPAYLINLLLAIDPTPDSDHPDAWEELRAKSRAMLDHAVGLILKHFADPESDYVFERFDAAWKYDRNWRWQQNRAIVGHNLKISWNLTRCGHYYRCLARRAAAEGDHDEAAKREELAEKCYRFAVDIGEKMARVGVDRVRGGIFDAVERRPANGMDVEFAWSPTKDFWQQEQAILAYYIMHGIPTDKAFEDRKNPDLRKDFLELGRSCGAFWNAHFLDHEHRKVYFRTTESGMPIVQNGYGVQAGHAIAGYHAFELSYLAHIYIRTYVDRDASDQDAFTLYFAPSKKGSMRTLNVLPDFLNPGDVKMVRQRIDGREECFDEDFDTGDGLSPFRVDLSKVPAGAVVSVELMQVRTEAGRDRLKALIDEHPCNRRPF